MWLPFRRVRCSCTACGGTWRIPVRRIHTLERALGLKKGQPFIWECHVCHEGAVIPRRYTNIHGETMTLDPTRLPPRTTVYRLP